MVAVRGPAWRSPSVSVARLVAPTSRRRWSEPLRVGPIAGGTPALQVDRGGWRDSTSSRSRSAMGAEPSVLAYPEAMGAEPGTTLLAANKEARHRARVTSRLCVARRLRSACPIGASDAPPRFVRRIVQAPGPRDLEVIRRIDGFCPPVRLGASDAPPQFVRRIAVRRIAAHGPGTKMQRMCAATF